MIEKSNKFLKANVHSDIDTVTTVRGNNKQTLKEEAPTPLFVN